MSRLQRLYDDDGAICSLNPAAPGVLFDTVTGNPMERYTDKWLTAVERLYALEGVSELLDQRDADEIEEALEVPAEGA